eukprot:CAMPEP_0185580342 /NCGR_PEP_ID=MMETSP0434-20130131/16179_1 /TAXON_ID=626734 ORGANISM="Favella taraikaensis, Strain Fe Narragansett Bay" /NCGR_SAMPLE_ID=MMETSP0434 /ASSEMBLY_ACC=CAM_ASM_000379 /LENGTH=144 /DNA_ID=CAMNT_0028198573 /DNA_START=107 /DNA_END=542 /DNA_ORIENTATION=-
MIRPFCWPSDQTVAAAAAGTARGCHCRRREYPSRANHPAAGTAARGTGRSRAACTGTEEHMLATAWGRHLVHLRLALVLLVVDGRLEERHAAAVALEAPEHGLDRGHHSEDVAIALVGLLITPLVFSIGAQALILVTSDIDGAP